MANFVLNYSFSRNLNIPLDEDAVMPTSAAVLTYVRTKSKCYPGQIFSVTGDTDDSNGLYMAMSAGGGGEIMKIGSEGNGSLALPDFGEAVGVATIENRGQIIYVENETYSYVSDGETIYTTTVPSGVPEYSTYEAGPYIVTGNGLLSKLGTTSASGEDVSIAIENLKSDVSNLTVLTYWEEGESGGAFPASPGE